MLLSFLFWMADGTTVLAIPVGPEDSLVLSLPPMSFTCPVGVRDGSDGAQGDEDDPEIEFLSDEEWGDEDETEP
jgi:hypothetical protein